MEYKIVKTVRTEWTVQAESHSDAQIKFAQNSPELIEAPSQGGTEVRISPRE